MSLVRLFSPTVQKSSISCMAIAVALANGTAHAQEATDGAVGVGDIVVTAEKRETSLQSTPLAISAVSAEQLQATNTGSLLDVANFAPNVMVGSQTGTGAQNGGFFIRGIGQDRSQAVFDQAVGVYIDDVYISRSDNSLLGIVDVDRVEVLRGPQGTLFGKNTIGGAIRYITKQPGPDLEGYVDATVGNFDRFDIKATVNVPLTNSLFVKATFGSLKRDGFIKHIVDDKRDGNEDTQVGRLQVRALISDAITLDLTATKTRTQSDGRAFIVDFIDPTDRYITRFTAKTGIVYDSRYVSPNPYTRYGGDTLGYDYDGYMLSAVLSADLTDNITLKSITGYMEADTTSYNDYDGTALTVYDTDVFKKLDQFSQEFQVLGKAMDNRLNYVLGLYYLRETPSELSHILTADDTYFPATRVTTIDQKVDSYAAFAQASLDVTDQFSVTAGLRYSKDKKSAVGTRLNNNYIGVGSGSWDNFSPRVTLDYKWTPQIMTYVTVSKGFRSGGLNIKTNGTVPVGQATDEFSNLNFRPETVWNYEAGIRSDLFNRRLRLNLTGFYMEYKDQQLSALLGPPPPIIQNVGKGHRTGFEVESVIAPFKGFTLRGNLGYLEAEYDDVTGASGLTTDSRVLRSPKWTYTVGGTYRVPVGEGSVSANMSYNYRSKQSTTSTDGNTTLLAGYGLLSARLQYDAPGRKWSVAAFATNLTDKVYYIGGIDFARRERFIGISTLDVGRPREFGANLRFNF